MLTKSIWLVPVAVLALAQGGADDKAKMDLERLQGVWVMHALEINGKLESRIQDTVLTIKKDEYKIATKGKDRPGFRIKLDPTKDPKWIDMIQTQPDGTEKVVKGIYSIENDTFKMCRGLEPTQERPNQLATWPNTNYFVVTWKKK